MTEVRLSHPSKESGPAYSFGKRHRGSMQEEKPGPGAYESPIKLENIKGGTRFGSSKRNGSLYTSDIPGPGSYYSEKNLH
jgi:hypothetical protein